MKNNLGREVPFRPYTGAFDNVNYKEYNIEKQKEPKILKSWDEVLDSLDLKDGMTVSFHHHLRNGDKVLSAVMKELDKRKYKNITVAASSIFPCHEILVDLMEREVVTKIHCDYMSGPVATAVSKGKCKEPCIITTHGGRPREILEEELNIDIAFLGVPTVDTQGNGTGSQGRSNCGVLGYAIADAQMAKEVVLITDHLVDQVDHPEILGSWVDFILEVEEIGDPQGILSGTTQITKDPVGLMVAKKCIDLLDTLELLKEGMSFQTGAGGISLAVAKYLKEYMKKHGIKGSFASGGITDYLVNMMEEGYFETLEDVQCFTIGATKSIEKNKNHKKMSANEYANINNKENIVNKLDIVILGASEIDLDFHVNVSTGSNGEILGGSGGHGDTAAGAKFSVIVSKLINSRISVVVDRVRTVTTPGETIDCLITDRGIVINPKHHELIEKAKGNPNLDILTMEELYERAIAYTGKPKKVEATDRPVAYSQYRDGTILDTIYQVK
ncbi:MAG: citrate lyase subunit alpha [Tissierellia bacterium]|nr:citrate lyase subunit alpha [Tissierellia bacterium]